jgi:hypothetical protein
MQSNQARNYSYDSQSYDAYLGQQQQQQDLYINYNQQSSQQQFMQTSSA